MSDNPLMQKSPLDVSPDQERALKAELLDENETSLRSLEIDKAIIERKREELDAKSKAKNLEIVEKLNQNLAELVELASDPMLARAVAGSIETGKDYNEFIKAIGSLTAQRDNLLQKSFDMSANSGKRRRIDLAFSGQGTVSIGLSENE